MDISSFLPSEIGYRAPRKTGVMKALSGRAVDLKERIMAKLETWMLHG